MNQHEQWRNLCGRSPLIVYHQRDCREPRTGLFSETWALFRDVGEVQTSVCLVKAQRKTKLLPPPPLQLRFSSRAAYHLQPLAWSRLWLRACQGRARRDGHNEPIGEPLRRCVAPAPPGSLLLLAFQRTHGGCSCFRIETTVAVFAVGGGARAYAVRLAAVKAPTRARPAAVEPVWCMRQARGGPGGGGARTC